MALHKNLLSMLEGESLKEMLVAAEYCVNYEKDTNTWPDNQRGGILGYPSATLLFLIADTIGSYFRGKKLLTIQVDGKDRDIKKKGHQHFFIFNSKYYKGLDLTEEHIKDLYNNYRSPLIHNSVIAPNRSLSIGKGEVDPFSNWGMIPTVNLIPFLELSKKAIDIFFDDADEVLKDNRIVTDLQKRPNFPFKEIVKLINKSK